jgi:hypothetical protein
VTITSPGGAAGDLRELPDGSLAVTGGTAQTLFVTSFDPGDGHPLRFASTAMAVDS